MTQQLAEPVAGPPSPAAPKRRDPFFDNAKFLAILLVVVGHAIEPIREMHGAMALYAFIYAFHMPLFIMITGYFSRSFGTALDRTPKLVATLLVPYLIFQTAYLTYEKLFGYHDVRYSFFDPYGLMWFILALLVWRVSTPFWQKVRWPLPIALFISLAAGAHLLPGELDMHNTAGMVPFYVLGLMLKPEHFDLVRRREARIAGIAVLAVAAAGAWLWCRDVNLTWLYWGNSYQGLKVSVPEGMAIRLVLFAGSTVLSFAFLTIVPRGQTWFTRLGANTLYVYLLHGFFTQMARYQDVYDEKWLNTMPGLAFIVVLALALGTLLSTPFVVRVFKPIMEPPVGWAFRRSEPAPASRGQKA